MPQDFRAKPNAVPWPPLIYSGALLLAFLLQRFDAFEWGDRQLALLPRPLGIARFVAGVVLDLWAFVEMRRKDTPVMPTAAARALDTTGPFRFTRNPIYVGNTLAMIGFGIALRWSWVLMLVPVAVAAVQWLGVSREEEHLERRFGADWRAYASRVRRWL